MAVDARASLVTVLALGAALLSVDSLSAGGDRASTTNVDRVLAQFRDPQPYRAFRRLEADTRGGSMTGWLDAWTEVTPAREFRYQIVAEGGSEKIRRKVLHAALEHEKKMVAAGAVEMSSANYVFDPSGLDDTGLEKVRLVPRRRDAMLVDGAMFLRPSDGDLVRVEGTLVKSPSFWIKKVELVRQFRQINGVPLPVSLDSTAHVRFYGLSGFRMTYQYETVAGQAVSDPHAPAGSTPHP